MHGSLPQNPQYSLKPQNPAIKPNHRNQHGTQWQNSGMEPSVAYPKESRFCSFHFSFLNKVFLSAIWASLVAQRVASSSACNAGGLGSIPGPGNPLEKEMATHSSILAWRIPWIEEPGRLQSAGSQRVGNDWATSLHSLLISYTPIQNVFGV